MRYKKVIINQLNSLESIKKLKGSNNKKPYNYLLNYIETYNTTFDYFENPNNLTPHQFSAVHSYLYGLYASEIISLEELIEIDNLICD